MQSMSLHQALFCPSSSPLLTNSHYRRDPLSLFLSLPRSGLLPSNPSASSIPCQLHLGSKKRGRSSTPIIRFAVGDVPPSSVAAGDRWLLEPVGDGDTRHLGYRVQLPSAFELASSVVTVGRLPDKADLVVPVATVSGLHARLEKKEGNLLVTDLDSTNGTYINDMRLKSGASAILTPGSCITFGDKHLAMFRASKIESVDAASESVSSQVIDVALE
ncbi:zeaxanthin epoxidase, chloroplastic [Nymphaea colorata]|nr:zeaxanthin epoxidase, chloroplastic [Nymphaea colorata]